MLSGTVLRDVAYRAITDPRPMVTLRHLPLQVPMAPRPGLAPYRFAPSLQTERFQCWRQPWLG